MSDVTRREIYKKKSVEWILEIERCLRIYIFYSIVVFKLGREQEPLTYSILPHFEEVELFFFSSLDK